MIGAWLDYQTPLKRVAAFAETADPKSPKEDRYVHSDAAAKWASKLRASVAGMHMRATQVG